MLFWERRKNCGNGDTHSVGLRHGRRYFPTMTQFWLTRKPWGAILEAEKILQELGHALPRLKAWELLNSSQKHSFGSRKNTRGAILGGGKTFVGMGARTP